MKNVCPPPTPISGDCEMFAPRGQTNGGGTEKVTNVHTNGHSALYIQIVFHYVTLRYVTILVSKMSVCNMIDPSLNMCLRIMTDVS